MKVTNGLDLQSQRIQNLADPSGTTDAATKQYVDNVARGLQWKAPVRVASVTNGTLASAFANGSVVDGVALATNDRILLAAQTAGAENGIYTVNSTGAPTRAVDADSGIELAPGTAVSVSEGTTNGDKVLHIISDAAITVGTTAQTWSQLGGGTVYTAGNGISIAGSSVAVSPAAGGGISVGAGGVAVDTTVVARKASANIGNGSLTSIAVAHNLGTLDVHASVRELSSNAGVLCDWVATDTNTVTFTFATAPSANAYRATIIA